MKRSCLLIVLLFVVGLSCCCKKQIVTEPVYSYVPPAKDESYLKDVKPILEKRCVVCHSCYNSPCQLKFSSWEGIDRGASKERVYNAERLQTMEPSRLFIDAQTTDEWRKKGFFSIKPESDGGTSYDQSVIFMLLDHKRKSPSLLTSCSEDELFQAEAEDLTCPKTTAEVNSFLEKHPNRGMPFGFPPLAQDEFNIVVSWLSKNAPGPEDEELKELKAIPAEDQQWIEVWEEFLNMRDPKHRLTARYIYEHLFLAHINFSPDANTFYELVRSHSRSGPVTDVIPTVRPYEDPGPAAFYYRFRKIHSTLVHKTHMVFPLDKAQYDTIQKLFIETSWEPEDGAMLYDKLTAANPFESFKSIPVRSRYEWLLYNGHYIIMTFIRGPVCKGQVALNVINDHFWLFFMSPDVDASVQDPEFLNEYAEKLRMPAEKGSGPSKFWAKFSFKKKYKPWVQEYYQARQQKYKQMYRDGLGADAIWMDPRAEGIDNDKRSERDQQQSLLTIFRHYDSASVHRGALGKLPKTVWVVDYPILERIYYSLVAGFDVYGTKGHQGMTRKYMDSLRIEAETAFLEFMPSGVRKVMMDSWYRNLLEKDDLVYLSTENQSRFPFTTSLENGSTLEAAQKFKREFLEYYVRELHLKFDANYISEPEDHSKLPATYSGFADWVRGFQAVTAKDDSFIKTVANENANVAWIKVEAKDGASYFSVLVDRWHDNVNYMDKEDLMLNSTKDKVDVVSGLVGSYPNYFFVVKEEEFGSFMEVLYKYDNSDRDRCRMETYGINRAEPRFWEIYDDFQAAFDAQHKERAGKIDLNRYYSLAMQKLLYNGGTQKQCEAIASQLEKDRRWWQ